MTQDKPTPLINSIDITHDERRTDHRVPLKMDVSVVFPQHKSTRQRPTYHGVTSDISMQGMSIVVEHNIFTDEDVTILIGLTPEHPGGPRKIIEVVAHLVYTVYSPQHYAFRIGAKFKEFKRNGEALLAKNIEQRMVKYSGQRL